MCTALVVGNIIGVGIFAMPATLAPYGLNAFSGWLVTVVGCAFQPAAERVRSEEHTSELQSLAYIVCRLLLEKKTTSRRAGVHCCRPQARSCHLRGVQEARYPCMPRSWNSSPGSSSCPASPPWRTYRSS